MSIQILKKSPWLVLIALILLVGTGFFVVKSPLEKAHAASGDISPTDTNIRYFGRWDTSSSTVYTSYWGGAYFKVGFTGTSVQIHLGAPVDIYVSIDGGDDVYYSNVSGLVNLAPTVLAGGNHTLRVATRAEWNELHFQGLTLDSGATTFAPNTSSNLIEFVGDSITAGYTDSKWALSDYAWLTGELLHSEHTQIAYSGICLVDNLQCNVPGSSIGMSRQFFKLQPVGYPNSPDWDFSRYQPNAVVINLGTNDNALQVDDTTFQNAYIAFLQGIRAKYPNAQIFVLETFSALKVVPTQNAVNAVNNAGDANVHYIDTTGWVTSSDLNDSVHPSDAGHIKIANRLAPILSSYLAGNTQTVDDSVQGNGLNQFNYVGNGWQHCTNCGSELYNQSNSWNTTTDDYVTVTFSGTQIKFYGVVSPYHGIGAVSLDAGPESSIDFYNANRSGNVLLWTSPVVSPGNHTFKLRVTGTENANSTAANVVPDRVDIIA